MQTRSSARRDTAGERRKAVALRTRNTRCSSSAQPQITTAPKINTPRGKKCRKGEPSNAQAQCARTPERRHPGENQPISTKKIPAKAPLAKDPTEDQRQKKCGDEQSPMKECKGKTRIAHQIHSRSREEAQSNRTPAKDPVTRELMAVEICSAPQMNGVEQKNGEGKEDMDEETCTANALNASGRSCLKRRRPTRILRNLRSASVWEIQR
ncbi:hypothetical protein C8R44DRAFT_947574 [Mycena epipterygia]|nr:hypothetical protein C8R44DRAFT_947574 [Mycena epipterygia]